MSTYTRDTREELMRKRVSARRAAQIRQRRLRRVVILSLSVLFLSIWGIRALALTAHADEIPSDRTKYYTSIRIESGDTLWSIAEEYISPEYENLSDYVSELKFMNGLTGSKIYAGNYLTIAYYK